MSISPEPTPSGRLQGIEMYKSLYVAVELPEEPNDPSFLDLATEMLGRYVHVDSPVVEWGSGHITAVPFLPDGKGGNKLYNDEYYMRRLTQATAVPPEGSEMVTVVDHGLDDSIIATVRDALINGKCVHVRNTSDVSRFEMTAEHLRNTYGLPPGMLVDYHGASHDLYNGVPI